MLTNKWKTVIKYDENSEKKTLSKGEKYSWSNIAR